MRRFKTHNFIGTSIISFCIFFLAMQFAASGTAYSAEDLSAGYRLTLPKRVDVELLAKRTERTFDGFMRESIGTRLAYECLGRFTNESRKKELYSLSQKSSQHMQVIISSQRLLKKQMEDYGGGDWEERFGRTGLWRKLDADVQWSIMLECEISYFQALAASEKEKRLILYGILDRLDSLHDGCRKADCMLLKAKIHAALSHENNDYKKSALHLLNSTLAWPFIDEKNYFEAALAKIKLTGERKPGQLDELAAQLAESDYKDDFELNFRTAFLQRGSGSVEGLERMAEKWPVSRAFMGELILLESSRPDDIEQLSVVEAELVAEAALQNGPEKYTELLNALSARPEFQTPVILHATAAAMAESSPEKAVDMLLKACRAQNRQKENGLSIPAEKIAGKAAELAYSLFTKDPNHCRPAEQAFKEYMALAGDKPEESLEYFYSIVLDSCGKSGEARRLLSAIARGSGKYHNKALYDLIALAVEKQNCIEPEENKDLTLLLEDLIAKTDESSEIDRKVRQDARHLYCQLLIAKGDKASAEQALKIIAELDEPHNREIIKLKCLALQQAGQVEKALKALIETVHPDDCSNAVTGLELLLKILERIDEYELEGQRGQRHNFEDFLAQCRGLAEYCLGCAPSSLRREAIMVLTELSIFSAGGEEKKLSSADKLLDELEKTDKQDVDLLRCRARLLMSRKQYDEAAGLWSRICQIRKHSQPPEIEPDRLWWRAKLYQLECLSRAPGSNRQDILHGLDVLEHSYDSIPEPWAEKLSELKKILQQQNFIATGSN